MASAPRDHAAQGLRGFRASWITFEKDHSRGILGFSSTELKPVEKTGWFLSASDNTIVVLPDDEKKAVVVMMSDVSLTPIFEKKDEIRDEYVDPLP